MAILIKDMEMPKKCGECDIYVCYRTWNGDPGDEFCGITKEDVSRETKPDWCPLKGIIMSEVPEREKGEWIDPGYDSIFTYVKSYAKCDQCGKVVNYGREMNFCPNCGADMRGE